MAEIQFSYVQTSVIVRVPKTLLKFLFKLEYDKDLKVNNVETDEYIGTKRNNNLRKNPSKIRLDKLVNLSILIERVTSWGYQETSYYLSDIGKQILMSKTIQSEHSKINK